MADPRFKAIVFDLFDTIVKWDPSGLPLLEWRGRTMHSTAPLFLERLDGCADRDLFLDAYQTVYGEILAERELAEPIEITCKERFVRTFTRLGLPDGEVERLASEFARLHMSAVRRVTKAPEEHAWAVRRLAPFFKLGLLSNFDDSRTGREVLFDTGVAHLFDAVIISADLGIRKPHPRIFAKMIEMIGVASHQTLFVGDTPLHDVAGAHQAGMHSAWISNGQPSFPDNLPAPTFVIKDLSELPTVLGY